MLVNNAAHLTQRAQPKNCDIDKHKEGLAPLHLWTQSTRTRFRPFRYLSMAMAAMQPSAAATTTCL